MGLKSKLLWFLILGGITACDDIIEVPEINEQEITVLAPLEGTILTDNTVSFNWNALEDARGYKVEVAQPNFSNAAQIVLDSLFVEDSLGLLGTKVQKTLLNGNYQWRVKGLNGGIETPFTTNSFTVNGDENIDLVAPNTPTLVAPTDGTAQDETSVSFSWSREDVPGTAERDSIYIYSDETLQTLELKGLGANKAFDTTLNSNTYYWLVQAFDAGGNKSADSTVFTLTIN
ncbi:hypothetical protein [Maribacter sp. 2308TA10-17]|uniref:hypothetical protein n=1 Tax=Maribacter sp. 2308TA10-17 TaxID=3386276 RepID=UPI0039BCE4AD